MTAPATTTAPAPGTAAAEVWELVRRAQAGDGQAFGLIYERYRESVFTYIYRRCMGSRQLAEDLTADTFERALRRIGSFTWQGRDLGAWLVTIARNLVADYYKSGRYRLEFAVGENYDAYNDAYKPPASRMLPRSPVAPAEPSDPVKDVLHTEAARALSAAVRTLTDQQREVIELRFWAGLTVAETARKMGIAEGACKAVQYRAVRALSRVPALQALWNGAGRS